MRNWLVLFGILFLMFVAFYGGRRCSSPSDPLPPDTITTVEVIPGDSILVPYPSYIPMPGETIYIDVPSIVDTNAILKDHYALNIYNDTIENDTSFKIVIIDTVTRNRLQHRSVHVQNLKPTAINITRISTHDFSKSHWYIGAIGILNSQTVYLGGTVGCNKNNKYHFEIGIGKSLFDSDFAVVSGYSFRF